MDRYAIFLDAGYVYAEGGKLCCGTGQRKDIQLDVAGLHGYLTKLAEAWTGLTALRMYWYDAARDGVANPSQRRVARLPNIKLRLGRLVSGRQKGVDALIYHDLMTLARTRAISDAILVSGDEDLREGVRTVQQMGVRVLLIGIAPTDQQSNQSRELLQEVDETQILTKDELDRFMDLRRPTSSPAAAESSGAAARSAAAEFAKNWSGFRNGVGVGRASCEPTAHPAVNRRSSTTACRRTNRSEPTRTGGHQAPGSGELLGVLCSTAP